MRKYEAAQARAAAAATEEAKLAEKLQAAQDAHLESEARSRDITNRLEGQIRDLMSMRRCVLSFCFLFSHLLAAF